MSKAEAERVSEQSVTSDSIQPVSAADADIDLDELQLQAQGHKGELPRHFSMMSLLAFAFSIMNSWTGVAPLVVTSLYLGGPTAATWTPILACIATFIIDLGLAELASAFPSSGGQYHFAFSVATTKYRSAIAFVTAWFNIYAYLIVVTSGSIIPAQVVAGLIQIYHPTFSMQRWQIWLIYAAILLFSTILVTLGPWLIPKTQSAFFWASILGVLTMAITILSCSSDNTSAKLVFASWDNPSGWSDGLAFMLATGQSMWFFVCADSATHLAEEIPQPSKNVPKAIILSPIIGLVSTVFFTLAFLFSSTDFSAIASSPLPIYEGFIQAMHSSGAVLFFCCWLVVIYVGCVFGIVTATGRLIWAFARDEGMPYSTVFKKINPRLKVPVNANILTCVFCLIFGALYIANTTAFNTFISSGIVFLNVSYTIPQAVLLFRERDKILPPRWLNLGRGLGIFSNAFSCAWMTLYTIFLCFPLAIPVTAQSMNYVSVVLTGGCLFVLLLWFVGGKRNSFSGPQINLDFVAVASDAALKGVRPEKDVLDGIAQDRWLENPILTQ